MQETLNKSAWGDGPWQNEPDKRQWRDPETGLPCLMIRSCLGNWCGYVGVGTGHPLFGIGYSEEVPILGAMLEVRKNMPIGENPSFAVLLACLGRELKASADIVFDVHGGITFAGYVEGNSEVWSLGFDCGHSGDYSPNIGLTQGKYRDVAYVESQVAYLAKQLAALSDEQALPSQAVSTE